VRFWRTYGTPALVLPDEEGKKSFGLPESRPEAWAPASDLKFA
jgi:hypothetical protein